MVVGKTSSFIEGFETITTDNKILKENVSKFLAYAMKNQKIPDLDPNMSEPTMPTGMALNKMMNQNMPTMKPSMMESTMPTGMSSTMKPSMMEPTMPTGMSSTMKPSMMESTMPTGMSSTMEPSMMESTMPTPSMTGVMLPSKKNNTIIKPGMKSSFKNVRNSEREDEGKDNGEDEGEDEMDNQETQEDDDQEEEMIQKRDKSTTRRQQKDDFEEGFQGSSMLEAKNLKNILLALLLSFIGYLVVYAYKHDYIPIKDISPQLVKFKHLVYSGLFFIISYICLEIF